MSDLRLTLNWVARQVTGQLASGSGESEIGPVTTDSRKLMPGDFFVALRGERHDGHAFVPDVLARGAGAVLVDRRFAAARSDGDAVATAPAGESYRPGGPGAQHGAGVIVVADTLKALQDLARAVRREAGTRVVAITGSAGKTTTKEVIAELLSTRYRVVRNRGNLNNHVGLPLSLMQLRARPDVAVMELGMNHRGEISTLVAIAEPEVRVWTNVGDAHLGFFDSPDAIADAKAEILEGATAETLLVYNADDPRITARVGQFIGRTTAFGAAGRAPVRAEAIEDLGIEGTRARLATPAGSRDIHSPLLGRGNLSNVLAAAAVALEFGVDIDAIAARIATLAPPDRRGAVRRLQGGVTLIDDSYNSSPAALLRSLDVMAADAHSKRKVAILGEMLELGAHATRLHEECGRAAARSGLDVLAAVGAAPARALADAAITAGLAPSAVSYFGSSDEAAAVLPGTLRPGDLVLVKGSRGSRTDVIADRIAEEFG